MCDDVIEPENCRTTGYCDMDEVIFLTNMIKKITFLTLKKNLKRTKRTTAQNGHYFFFNMNTNLEIPLIWHQIVIILMQIENWGLKPNKSSEKKKSNLDQVMLRQFVLFYCVMLGELIW